MDPTNFKDVTVQRGYTYHYYYSPASEGNPTLFFVHGFPSTSFDWSRQVAYFQPKGYGILVPDCLGYGGTSKPLEMEAYRVKLHVRDLVDILNAEGLSNVIGIGHDWGSLLLSRLASYHEDRFIAFAWLAMAYVAPNPNHSDYKTMLAAMRQRFGNKVTGTTLLSLNLTSWPRRIMIQLAYSDKPEVWANHLGPLGKAKEWIEQNRQPGRASWLTEEEYVTIRDNLVRGGLRGPFNYYKVLVSQVDLADEQGIPKEAYYIQKPAFFAATLQDRVCRSDVGKATMQKYAPQAEIVEFDAGHWVQFEATEQLNDALDKWIRRLAEPTNKLKL